LWGINCEELQSPEKSHLAAVGVESGVRIVLDTPEQLARK
jgi:hypothetical protein